MEIKLILNYPFHNGNKGVRRLKFPQVSFQFPPSPFPDPSQTNSNVGSQIFFHVRVLCLLMGGNTYEEVRWQAPEETGEKGERPITDYIIRCTPQPTSELPA